ncbi:hypothetical protein G7066_09020 [Leucobacter coleopterorum]|uniref:Regulator of chromosome condensation (RCC1) repeat-containing protein n=1 Tax=Leucobacter coleopterorum TaxID=2714933 RepID=A0ABX6K0F5_9MICO|nr:hypothetical protein [Leucobacter coleopterorum]QIM18712.1 hypothetical protein G7066_09020 [Leucobacter coleopterorum]
MNKLRQRLGKRLRALSIGATVMLVVGLTTVLGGGTAVALWSIDSASIIASARADTLRALDKPVATATTATQISLQAGDGVKSDTLSPRYSLERSVTSDFSNPVAVGTADSSTFTDNGHLAAVATSSTFTKIVMGTDAGCGITAGKVMCWGNNTSGQLGQGTLEGNSGTPLQVKSHADDVQSDLPADVAILDIAAGLRTFCVTTSTQDVYCWGRNESGAATGNSTDMKPFPTKVAATPRGNVSSITVGNSSACAPFDGFGAYCWGSNSVGQLGAGIAVSAGPFAPRKVLSAAAGSDIPAGTTLQMIRAGNDMGCVITSGVAYCWGVTSIAV